jgi:hypothetical protein
MSLVVATRVSFTEGRTIRISRVVGLLLLVHGAIH